MQNLINILTATNTEEVGVLDMLITADIGSGPEDIQFIYDASDPYGALNPQVAAWLLSNPDFEIGPYVEPPAPEPIDPLAIELPRREFRRALLHNGMDTTAVLSVINAISDPTEREEMTIWWEDTQHFQRQHPVLVQMVAAAGLTPEQGDAIWTYGVGLLQGE